MLHKCFICPFYLWWNIYRVIYFFFSLHCGERQKDHETWISFWCLDVGGKAVTGSVTEGSAPCAWRGRDPCRAWEQRLCVPYLGAVFLSQVYRMMSRLGDAWKINCVSLLCIIRTKAGVKFLFRLGGGIGMMNFSSRRFEPEHTWSFGG